ncbi:MAG: hypothetical protein ACM3Q1_05910 [Bacteroidales bacterium]
MITFSLADLPRALKDVHKALPCAGDGDRLASKGVEAFSVNRNGEPCGALIVGTVCDGFGADLVIYAAAGEGGGLTEAMDDFCLQLADAAGLDGVRCFTHRPGLVRKLARLGWAEQTRMMRVAVR